MKVFISSVVAGLAAERDAAASAAALFSHEVLRSEALGASPESPQRACLDLVRQADVSVLILGSSYGSVPPGRELSPTHEEYREARELGKDVLVFVSAAEPDDRQRAFIEEARQWASGNVAPRFSSPQELRDLVIRDLRSLELARAAGRADPQEMLARARAAVANVGERRRDDPTLVLSIAFGPAQQIIRPREMADASFQRVLEREALYGEPAVLLHGAALETKVEAGRLAIRQDRASLLLAPDGTVVLSIPAATEREHSSALVEEDVGDAIARGLRFVGVLIDRLDPTARLSDAAVVAAVERVGYSSWLTRAQHSNSRTYSMNMHAPARVEVSLDPPHRRRRALIADAQTMAEDLTELLRQRIVE